MPHIRLPVPAPGPSYPHPVSHRAIASFVLPLVALVLFAYSRQSRTTVKPEVVLQGGQFDHQLHSLLRPTCDHGAHARPYNTSVRTAFASFPRSGNSYLRSLMERATGFQTSSVYCDKGLLETFAGECDESANFFVKTHYPTLPLILPPNDTGHFHEYNQVLHLIRNPLDAVASWWNLEYAALKPGGLQDHEAKLVSALEPFGAGDRARLIEFAKRWRNHAIYWTQAPLRTLEVRYEDLREEPLAVMMSIILFLLPEADRPSVERLACLADVRSNSAEPYKSQKLAPFASWDLYPPVLRREILMITRRPFCAFGYNRVLRDARGETKEMDGFCEKVRFGAGSDGFYVEDTPTPDYQVGQ